MSALFPELPAVGTPLPTASENADVRHMLATRRSANKRALAAPGPSPAELEEMLAIAARVPDHRNLGPWRFILFEGEARNEFGNAAAAIQLARDKAASERDLDETRALLTRAPTVVGVVSSPDKTHKTPVWEQELSAGALCYNLLLAARAAGYSACWLTEWISFDTEIARLLGLTADERMAGFLYIGTSEMDAPERARPDMAPRISRWTGPADA